MHKYTHTHVPEPGETVRSALGQVWRLKRSTPTTVYFSMPEYIILYYTILYYCIVYSILCDCLKRAVENARRKVGGRHR